MNQTDFSNFTIFATVKGQLGRGIKSQGGSSLRTQEVTLATRKAKYKDRLGDRISVIFFVNSN